MSVWVQAADICFILPHHRSSSSCGGIGWMVCVHDGNFESKLFSSGIRLSIKSANGTCTPPATPPIPQWRVWHSRKEKMVLSQWRPIQQPINNNVQMRPASIRNGQQQYCKPTRSGHTASKIDVCKVSTAECIRCHIRTMPDGALHMICCTQKLGCFRSKLRCPPVNLHVLILLHCEEIPRSRFDLNLRFHSRKRKQPVHAAAAAAAACWCAHMYY